MSLSGKPNRKATSRLSKGRGKLNRKKTVACALADAGPTPEILTHGEVEINAPNAGKRGLIMAKRVGMHERLYARGKITDAEWNWACRYVRETEIASGARLGPPESEPPEAWGGPLIYNRQCAAAGFLRQAHERITGQERLVLIAACVECATIEDLGPLLGLQKKPGEADGYLPRISRRALDACKNVIVRASGLSGR